jgi:hypothetical protein
MIDGAQAGARRPATFDPPDDVCESPRRTQATIVPSTRVELSAHFAKPIASQEGTGFETHRRFTASELLEPCDSPRECGVVAGG